MGKHAGSRLVWRLVALVFILACGCNLMPSFSGNNGGGESGFANMPPGKPGPNHQDKPFSPPGKGDYPLPPPTPLPEQASLIYQRMSAIEDDRKVLAARLQQMEGQLQEKEKVVVLANYEIKEATKQVTQTREELKRWKEEMEALRGQLRSMEKENKGTLEAIIRTLEQFMDREKELPKGSEATGPILPK